MKVLVAVSAKRDMLYNRSVESILSLRWEDGHQIDTVFLTDGDDEGRWENLLRKLNQAREMALDGGYDALLTVESDIIVPPDALEKMASVNTDVVYGLFVLRFPPYHWNVATKMRPRGEIHLLSADPVAAREAWGKVIPCEGHGQGICLIRRDVLEEIEFRNPQPALRAQDWYFSFDCQRLGFAQMAHLGVVCGHIHGDGILWPHEAAKALFAVYDEDGWQGTEEKP